MSYHCTYTYQSEIGPRWPAARAGAALFLSSSRELGQVGLANGVALGGSHCATPRNRDIHCSYRHVIWPAWRKYVRELTKVAANCLRIRFTSPAKPIVLICGYTHLSTSIHSLLHTFWRIQPKYPENVQQH